MASRGRKPVPTVLHKLRGTERPARHAARASEPVAAGELGGAPEWMTPSQVATWDYALDHAPAGLLKMIDQATLAIWVLAADRLRVASIALAAEDAATETPLLRAGRDGALVASPYVSIIARQSEIMLRAAAELGFTPSSRPRLGVAGARPVETVEPSAWERIQSMRGASNGT